MIILLTAITITTITICALVLRKRANELAQAVDGLSYQMKKLSALAKRKCEDRYR